MIARPYDNLKIQWFISIVFAVLVGTGAADVVAAASVTSVSGAVTQGNTVQISGSNFGTHSLEVEWLGNAIEQGADGSDFSKAGWDNNWGWSNAKYTSGAIHSGSKSLKVIVDSPSGLYNGIFSFQLANPVKADGTLYVTWWVRKDNQDNTGQWKMLRLSGNKTIVDGAQELVLFNWNPYNGGGSKQIVLDPGTSNDQTRWPGDTYFAFGDNNWYRQELVIKASSLNQNNGTATLTRYDNVSVNSYSAGANLRTHVNSSDTYSYVIWQNYVGNGLQTANIWFDDVYIQPTAARVELCDAPSWGARTHCEIQVPTAWSGTAITIKANTGSFTNGKPAYLYVLDAGGNVNASGYPVTIGGSSAVLAAPSNLRVQ